LPVKNGWQMLQISSLSSGFVDRVFHVFPKPTNDGHSDSPLEFLSARHELIGGFAHQQLFAVHQRNDGVGHPFDPGDLVDIDDHVRPVEPRHVNHATPDQDAYRSASAITSFNGTSRASAPACSSSDRT